MGIMGVLKWLCLVVFGLLWAELEAIREGEFMSRPVSQEQLSERSMAVVYENGAITINDADMAVIELDAQEAYALLDALYRHIDVLRQRKDEPQIRLLTEEEVQALADRIQIPKPVEHDHLCRCQGCNYDGPDPTEEEASRIMAEMGPEPEMPDWAQE